MLASTPAEQRVVQDIRTIQTERGDCFAMIIVSRKERNGLLAGLVPATSRLATRETGA